MHEWKLLFCRLFPKYLIERKIFISEGNRDQSLIEKINHPAFKNYFAFFPHSLTLVPNQPLSTYALDTKIYFDNIFWLYIFSMLVTSLMRVQYYATAGIQAWIPQTGFYLQPSLLHAVYFNT